MYASTGEKAFKDRVDCMVRELAALQEAGGEGYIGAFKNGKTILAEQVGHGL